MLLFILSLSTRGGFEPPVEMPGALQERLLSGLSYFHLQVTSEQFLKRALPCQTRNFHQQVQIKHQGAGLDHKSLSAWPSLGEK